MSDRASDHARLRALLDDAGSRHRAGGRLRAWRGQLERDPSRELTARQRACLGGLERARATQPGADGPAPLLCAVDASRRRRRLEGLTLPRELAPWLRAGAWGSAPPTPPLRRR